MLRLRPFPAIRPAPSQAASVASVPYDVVNTEEARALAEGNPASFLHIVRPEIDLPPGTNPYDDAVYLTAKTNFDRFLADGILIRDETPALFLYQQALGDHSQIGVVGCCHIDDYNNDVIKKHEKTRPDKEDDRTRHVQALSANTGPVFLTYRDRNDLAVLIERDSSGNPLYDFQSPDGVTHTVWMISNPDPYIRAFAEVPAAYVADGHHRSASAARAGAERRAANPTHTGQEPYNWFLTCLFPASDLNILAYNRTITDLNNLSPNEVRTKLSQIGTLTETDIPTPDRAGVFCIYLDGTWLRLELDPATIDHTDPINSLDVALLHDRILGPIFTIGDPRTDTRIDFVGGIRGTDELARRVDSTQAALAISMFPTSIDQLLTVADAGQVMPPKSTWFEPKLRSGLFVNSLDQTPIAAAP